MKKKNDAREALEGLGFVALLFGAPLLAGLLEKIL